MDIDNDKWNAEHIYKEIGEYTIIVRTNCGPNSVCIDDEETVSVQQSPDPQSPDPSISIVNTDPNSPQVNDEIQVEGSTANAPSDLVTVGWGDDSGTDRISLRDDGEWTATHTYEEPGEYTITATLCGNLDRPCIDDEETVSVQQSPDPQSPDPSISIVNTDPNSPQVNDEIQVEGSTTDITSGIVYIDWGDQSWNEVKFSDGLWTASHVYQTEKDYTIRAVLIGCQDTPACIDTESITLSLENKPEPPRNDSLFSIIIKAIIVGVFAMVIYKIINKIRKGREIIDVNFEIFTRGGVEE